MLNLKLRQEFVGKRLKGTAIELANRDGNGAIQVPTAEFLEITYPTHDILKGLEAIGPDRGQPIVVIGERGSGKSHLLATLHHAATNPKDTEIWLKQWSQRLPDETLASMKLRDGMLVISSSMHLQEYKHLWDLLFANHPKGDYYRGKWEASAGGATNVPPASIIEQLLTDQPVVLLVDEFQTWYEGLTNTKQYPHREWAYNFIQILSELATNRPDLLVLVVSVRNGATDAYQQIHRNNPVRIDFQSGGSPERIQQDRRRMLLHRLFENRLQIPYDGIQKLISIPASEYLRLMEVPSSEHQKVLASYSECWPYSPSLLQLLEDQVLVATSAQETRDLIRILANLYKSRGESVPVLTAADFQLDDEGAGIVSLLDSVSNQQFADLRVRAQRNLQSVVEAIPNPVHVVPHLNDILASLWLRSIAVGNKAGAERAMLQIDSTRANKIDDNTFHAELSQIIENSFNIHEEGERLVFRAEENPQAKLMSTARNDKQFADGQDYAQLAKETRYSLVGQGDVAMGFRVIVLPKDWMSNPWAGVSEEERPSNWDQRLPILVLPEEPDSLGERLGRFLKDHLAARRNTVRFLIPQNPINMYLDRELIILARAVFKANEYVRQGSIEYRALSKKYETDLRDLLKVRFNRVAILETWNFGDPSQCRFHVEGLQKTGTDIPERIKYICGTDLWVQEDFDELIKLASQNSDSVGKFLKELQEPRPNGKTCIPWLGEIEMRDRIVRLCAQGLISLDVRGSTYLQANAGELYDQVLNRIQPLFRETGRQLDEVRLLVPSAVPSTGGATTPVLPVPPTGPIPPPPPQGGLWGTPLPTGTTTPLTPTPPPKPRTTRTREKTSALNQIGQLEMWGVGPATQVQDLTLKITSATGAQLKEILKKLPDGMTLELSFDVEES